MQKKVSVCIPSYNTELFIGETINSVLASEYQNFEIIIHDDASSDNTPAIVESFRDSRIRFYKNERNVGPVRNWNLAMTKATGEYVSLIADDDLYGPFWLMFAVYHLEKNPRIDWVHTAHRIIDAEGKTIEIRSCFRTTGEIPKNEAFLEVAKHNGLGPGFVARRKILEEIGFYDENVGPGADNYLYLQLAMKYSLFYCATYPHTSYRLRHNSVTGRYHPVEQTRDCIRMLEKAFNDPCLPPELAKYRKECFENFFLKSKIYAEKRLRHRDEDAYRKVFMILRQSGYEG
jgi:glycosyltransferase involved in cell wall biosynthesis